MESIRLIDEIYAELHNGEKPPYTNARRLKGYTHYTKFFYEDDLIADEKKNVSFKELNEMIKKFQIAFPVILEPKFYIPPCVD